jgi:hypothetical protein
MIEQAVTLYISIVVIACTVLTGTALYAVALGEGNIPDKPKTKKQYQGLALVLGVMSIWGIMILFG